jgi:two-component system response regulator MprA
VADHDASVRAGILEALERSGYRVLLADDGQDAVDLIGQESPDLVLAEARLPRVDGLELCRRIREEGHSIPILILHPQADEEFRQKVLQAGGDGLLSRAVSATGWVRALVHALTEITGREENRKD